MQKQIPKKIKVFYRANVPRAEAVANTIQKFIGSKFPRAELVEKNPDAVIVIGGDGTILEAARTYGERGAVILGLNLGKVGFLASVREEKRFLFAVRTLLTGKYRMYNRVMLVAEVRRKGKAVFKSKALNEFVVQNILGVVELGVAVQNHPLQWIRGTGVLVATSTGSTAYNISAHGPIVMPDIPCFIVTELLDHNIPTPSVVVGPDKRVTVTIENFRPLGRLSITKTKEPVDVVLTVDGTTLFPLRKDDVVSVRCAPRGVAFAEIEPHYFLKSLEEKFAFK